MNKKNKIDKNYGKQQNKMNDNYINQEVYKRYDLIFSNSLTGVVIHDPKSKIIYCNKQAEIILGQSYLEMIGKKAADPGWKFINEDGSVMKLKDYPVMKVIKNKSLLIIIMQV